MVLASHGRAASERLPRFNPQEAVTSLRGSACSAEQSGDLLFQREGKTDTAGPALSTGRAACLCRCVRAQCRDLPDHPLRVTDVLLSGMRGHRSSLTANSRAALQHSGYRARRAYVRHFAEQQFT